MRMLGKVLLAIAVVLGAGAMFLGGLFAAFGGFLDQYADHYTYIVGFKHEGDDCGNNNLSVDLDTGEALKCGPPGIKFGSVHVDLPGFSEEQVDQVLTLSAKLGADGFTPAERSRLQGYVDSIHDSLPPGRVEHHRWLWGWKLGTLGLVAAAVPAVVVGLALHRVGSDRPPKAVRRRPNGGTHR